MTTTYIQLTREQLAQFATDAVACQVQFECDRQRTAMIGKIKYYTAEQAAQMIGVSTETIRKYSRDGRLTKRGGASNAKYHIEDIELFVWNRNQTKPL